MKLKDAKEIGEIANNIGLHDAEFYAFKKGVEITQQDLVESASDGWEEYFKKHCEGEYDTENNYLEHKYEIMNTWQASRLHTSKEYYEHNQKLIKSLEVKEARIEELEKTVANQEKERQRSEAFWKDKLISIQEESLGFKSKLNEAREDIKFLINVSLAYAELGEEEDMEQVLEIKKKWIKEIEG